MKKLALLLLCVSTLSLSARADTYLYDVTLVGRADATFETSSLIFTPTTVTPITCTTGGDGDPVTPCNSVTIIPYDGFDTFENYEYGFIDFQENGVDRFSDNIIASVAFNTLGSNQYNDIDNITITDLSTTASTPEPSSLILLGTGALGMIGAVRRRLAHRPHSSK